MAHEDIGIGGFSFYSFLKVDRGSFSDVPEVLVRMQLLPTLIRL